MITELPVKRRRWPLVLIAIALFIAGGVGYDKMRLRGSDHGFRHVTGRDLAANVTTIAHGSEVNDNLRQTTHYWRLQGRREDLRTLATQLGLTRSDEDAARVLQRVARVMPLGEPPRLSEGYEGSRDGGRDRWLMILEPGDRAVFAY